MGFSIYDTYREVNQHMARSANRLANDEDWPGELEQDSPRARIEDGNTESSEPPRDYAPKSDPKEKGTLAEDFGLKEKNKA